MALHGNSKDALCAFKHALGVGSGNLADGCHHSEVARRQDLGPRLTWAGLPAWPPASCVASCVTSCKQPRYLFELQLTSL